MHFSNIINELRNNRSSKITGTASTFFIKKNYRHRLKPQYLDDFDRNSGTIWQPYVYDFVAKIAKRFDCKYIIDIGCGSAKKLVPLYPQFEILGIDFGDNIKNCRKDYHFGTWMEHNLEDSKEIILPEEILQKSAIICSDVIEHLINPIPLLSNIKKLLNFSSFCIITTPERDLARGKDDVGPPKNLHHIREWNLVELKELLQFQEFKISFMGLTVSNTRDNMKKTIIVGINNQHLPVDSKKWKGLEDAHTKLLKKF